MRSNYKKIGKFVQQVKNKNNANNRTVEHLRGINITKEFMPSVANVTGTDLSVYKVVEKNQFAYNPMHVGRDEILPISMLAHEDSVIVSPAYVVFEIVDTNELLPEYLMMWCRRSEFDRNAWFTTDSSVRGGFNWEDFCDLELPIPSIEKQKELIKEYHTITDRIKLNEQLIQKLEDTAQSIYKEWFINFEFPDENGKPYKSNDGEMDYSEELEMEIPKGWKKSILSTIIKFCNGKTKPKHDGTVPVYGGNGILGYTNQKNYENIIVIGRVGAYCGSLYNVIGGCWISDNAICATTNNMNAYTFYLLKYLELNSRSEGTGQPLLTQSILNSIEFLLPEKEIINKFNVLSFKLLSSINCIEESNKKLVYLKEILLSKMATIEG